MKKISTIIAALLILAACDEFDPVFTTDYDDPEVESTVSMTATHTIAELAAMYTIGNPFEVTEDIVISGIVSTTDQPGNFYKSLYIQDETGGIEVKIGKNGLYNIYKPGQRIYVNCKGLTVGMYGYSSSYGNGMVQIGYSDPSGEYETSYIEVPLLIDTHIYKGDIEGEVTPIELTESDLPSTSATQATNHNVGKLVTISDLEYGWYDTRYKEQNEVFVLLYLDSNKDKKTSSNRIFVSGEDTGVTTWAMSKERMKEYIYSGIWDDVYIGNASDYNYGTVGDLKGDGTYPSIEKAAYSVSQYFSTSSGTCVQIRTSGYCKFSDTEVDPEVLAGNKKISVTGIMSMYQGKIQMIINNIDDITVQD